jgi:hypothetical protein
LVLSTIDRVAFSGAATHKTGVEMEVRKLLLDTFTY